MISLLIGGIEVGRALWTGRECLNSHARPGVCLSCSGWGAVMIGPGGRPAPPLLLPEMCARYEKMDGAVLKERYEVH